MDLLKYKFRFQQMDQLIRMKATGPPKSFALKLSISESHLYRLIEGMRMLGAPIQYSKKKQTYYYVQEGSFILGFLEGNSGDF
ncbi:MAG: hypothetical protein AAFQ83_09145 [Bacteroidota bacterium]